MSEELKRGPGAGQPDIGLLYVKQTEARISESGRSVVLPGIIDIFGGLSVTSQFKVSLHLSKNSGEANPLMNHLFNVGVLNDKDSASYYDFLCTDASLPGSSLNSSQESGSRQGIIENFPTSRVFPPFEITLYVDKDYKVIRLFEEWMNFINPLHSYDGIANSSERGLGNYKNRSDFYRMRYPDDYKKIISITKFERNFFKNGTDRIKKVSTVTYRMIDAYPDQLNSIPVMYEGSIITKTTVRFLYNRYVTEFNKGDKEE